ncbi:MAG: 3-dehydroquinate synthase [Candidatus Margulisiibacteriota bacterium]
MANIIKVKLKDRSYSLIIGSGILSDIKKYIGKLNKTQVVIISDHTVGGLYGKWIKNNLKNSNAFLLELPPGEKHKTLSAAAATYDKLIDLKINRDALIIALGGGVIGDLAGFVASTYMRGVDLIHIPTTLLAMVDASIGGKTAVDHHKGKNLIGAFYQPKMVLIDIDVLATLPPKELKNGLAEAVKYGVIKDPAIFKMLEGNPKVTPAFWQKLIYLCAKIKAEVVSKDEREMSGYRMILNFGHTIGHAVESLTGYKAFSHGEAVAFGMVAASLIARKIKLIDQKTYERIKEMVTRLKLPVKAKVSAAKILRSIKLDKKARSGKVRFVLPVSIGRVTVRENVPENIIKKALLELGCK